MFISYTVTASLLMALASAGRGHSSSSSSTSSSSSSKSSSSSSTSSCSTSSSSSSSSSWTSDSTSITYRHHKAKKPIAACHSNFVVVTPPVGWEKAEEVCALNGYHLAKINEKNLHAALKMLRVANYDAAWIKSYMGHGCDKDAAVVLRPGKTICTKAGKKVKPTTVKIMQRLKAGKCHKQYPVLCQSKKPCPDTKTCLMPEKRPKKCHGKEAELCTLTESGKLVCKRACPTYSSSASSKDSYTSCSTSSSTDSTYVEVKVAKGHRRQHGKAQKKQPAKPKAAECKKPANKANNKKQQPQQKQLPKKGRKY